MGEVTKLDPCDEIRQQRDDLVEAAKQIRPERNKAVDWWRLQAAIARADGEGPDSAA